jgi:4-diphosphocytidyl-2-C-methyl-D-erythritol kinase
VRIVLDGQSHINKPQEAIDRADSFPTGTENLIFKAAQKFSECTILGKGLRVEIQVRKTIPIAAGLAGGSGNAAATFAALNEFFNRPCSKQDLLTMAEDLGADVPFCLTGGTATGAGKGQILRQVNHDMQLFFVVVKPRHVSISSAWIYQAYDEYAPTLNVERDPQADPKLGFRKCVRALQDGDLPALKTTFHNAFESIVFSNYPALLELRERMIRQGCLSANITGSGPTLFGLVPTAQAGQAILRSLLKENALENPRLDYDCWLARSVNYGIKLVAS